MKMRWTKLGRVLAGEGRVPWARTHAALPIPEPIEDAAFDVYFSARDISDRAHIGVGRLDLNALEDGIDVRKTPVLEPGSSGAFDESGVTSSCLVSHDDRRWLYYTGWTRGVTVPFYFYIGLAVSDDDGRSFARVSRAPILERTSVDPYLTASPWVIVEDGLWRMWYVSGVKWVAAPAGPRHYYHVKYAESRDGIAWTRHGHVCIDFESDDEYAIARPCVIKDRDGVYRMWYSVRGASYRTGFAESRDGVHWIRLDASAGIDVSPSGWDSEMIAYPAVFDSGNRRYMLYNGNGYGRTGIGLAVLEEPSAHG